MGLQSGEYAAQGSISEVYFFVAFAVCSAVLHEDPFLFQEVCLLGFGDPLPENLDVGV
jgi:hypothetical protein